MNAQQHQELLNQFISLGGNRRLVSSLQHFSLRNFAQLRYEVGKLAPSEPSVKSKDTKVESQEIVSEKPKVNKVFNDFIVDYPVVLHSVYHRRWEVWLKACSIKIQLNEIPEKEAEKAFAMQWQIYQLFTEFDHCQSILKHYREHKRVIPFEVKKDFENMSEMEVFKYRNNLRTLITRRKQTIEKMEKELPPTDDFSYPKRLHTLNLRKEQLEQKQGELIACNKILNDE